MAQPGSPPPEWPIQDGDLDPSLALGLEILGITLPMIPMQRRREVLLAVRQTILCYLASQPNPAQASMN